MVYYMEEVYTKGIGKLTDGISVTQERIARIGLENGGSICVHYNKSQGSQLHSLL